MKTKAKKRSIRKVRTKRSPKKRSVHAKPKSIIDTNNWSDRNKTEFFEMRCTKNFKKVLEALEKVPLKPHSYFASNTKSDVVLFAVRELAKKHKLITDDNEHWI